MASKSFMCHARWFLHMSNLVSHQSAFLNLSLLSRTFGLNRSKMMIIQHILAMARTSTKMILQNDFLQTIKASEQIVQMVSQNHRTWGYMMFYDRCPLWSHLWRMCMLVHGYNQPNSRSRGSISEHRFINIMNRLVLYARNHDVNGSLRMGWPQFGK